MVGDQEAQRFNYLVIKFWAKMMSTRTEMIDEEYPVDLKKLEEIMDEEKGKKSISRY